MAVLLYACRTPPSWKRVQEVNVSPFGITHCGYAYFLLWIIKYFKSKFILFPYNRIYLGIQPVVFLHTNRVCFGLATKISHQNISWILSKYYMVLCWISVYYYLRNIIIPKVVIPSEARLHKPTSQEWSMGSLSDWQAWKLYVTIAISVEAESSGYT